MCLILERFHILVETQYHIFAISSNPSRIYGLPKLHKSDIPLRPIVSGIGSYTHKLAKYLSDILKPLANNEHTLKDSFEFTHQILGLDNVPFMCSFDIVSLFTCIPEKETIELCLDLLYKDTELVHNLTRSQFKKLLVYVCKKTIFVLRINTMTKLMVLPWGRH